jgi:hypothetical protein
MMTRALLLLTLLLVAAGPTVAGPADSPLLWSTFLGSDAEDQGAGVALDGQGRVLAAGFTSGSQFPADAPLHGVDAFAARFAADGAALDVLYWFNALTLFAEDEAYAVAVDDQDNIYVTGYTRSEDFCAVFGSVPGYQPVYQGETDAFVAKIRADGSGLAYCTFLGGDDWDVGRAIAVDQLGNAYVAGGTWSADFPTTPDAMQPALAGLRDSFLVKLSAAGSALLYGTYLGGAGQEEAVGVHVSSADSITEHLVHVAGWTNSADFPVTPGAIGPVYRGNTDGFAYRLDLAARRLDYSIYLGGSGQDWPAGLALAAGQAVVAGSTHSVDFPTTAGALAAGPLGGQDGFLTQIAPDGSGLVFSTFVGGSGDDSVSALAVGSEGTLFLAGATTSADFPTTAGALSTALRGPRDAALLRLTPDGASLLYGTYLGGGDVDQALGVAVGGVGHVAITGSTASADFPVTPGAFDTSYNGGGDAFVARLGLGVWSPAPHSVFLPLLLRQ